MTKNQTNELISIVITTKDRRDFLCRALKSIISSTVIPKNIVVVNDGESIEKDFLYPEIPSGIELILINNEYSKGANASRNIGINLCPTDIVFLLDDDDALTKTSIEDRFTIMNKSPDTVLTFTGVNFVYSDNLDCIIRSSLPYNLSTDNCSSTETLFKKGNIIGSTSRVCIRKNAFLQAGQFDESLNCLQDYDLWIRMSKLGKLANDKKTNILYTIHKDGQQISSQYQKYLETGLTIYKKYQINISNLNLKKQFLSQIYLRVAIIASKISAHDKIKYCLLSLSNKINFRALLLLILPSVIIKRIHPYN
ncbi:glycosyltransferase [Providencia sp. wls1922]|uniref:glycosyltransferase family 2 protein n=1 Tax=Providencia sp. wls1922 TaxID=2675152 RepID=UPI0012B5BAA5|nr:glycosyltransferase family A protein [Providencia sp. wls1922]MTC45747.1 glycosyltransferase [Providencia sp. wls1922]